MRIDRNGVLVTKCAVFIEGHKLPMHGNNRLVRHYVVHQWSLPLQLCINFPLCPAAISQFVEIAKGLLRGVLSRSRRKDLRDITESPGMKANRLWRTPVIRSG